MHIGAAIRHMRETLQLKLEMVALDAGFDPGNLSRIETGRQNPSIPRLESIAKAMNVSVADLYALVEAPRALVSTESQPNHRGRTINQSHWVKLRTGYELLNDRRRQLLLEFLDALVRMEAEEAGQGVDEPAAARVSG